MKKYNSSKVSSKEETTPNTCTGKYSSSSKSNLDWAPSKNYLAKPFMLNPQDLSPPKLTFGKKTPELKIHNSFSANGKLSAMLLRIGNKSTIRPKTGDLMKSRRTYSLEVIAQSSESVSTILDLISGKLPPLYSADQPAPVNLILPGTKPVWMRSLKIHSRNSGMDILVNITSLLTNFAVLSPFQTYSDGWIDIQFEWK